MTIELSHSETQTSVTINGLIHLWIKGKVIGVMAYMDTKEGEYSYFIEWHTKEKMILTEYDKRGLWEKILKLINKHITNG